MNMMSGPVSRPDCRTPVDSPGRCGRRRPALLTLLFALSLSDSISVSQETAGQLFERARFLEVGNDDLEGAIRLYQRVVREHASDRKTAAQAWLRIGMCYERLGMEGAAAAYRTILEQFTEQSEIVQQARRKLDSLTRGRASLEISPAGIRIQQITLQGGAKIRDANARLSPDGTELLYYDPRRSELRVADLRNETTRTVLHSEKRPRNYIWAPDGRSAAVGSSVDGAVWLLNLQTNRHQIFYRHPGGKATPAGWSAGGEHLLCLVEQLQPAPEKFLGLVTPQGTLSSTLKLEGEYFRISPDGRFIAYTAQVSGDDCDIKIASIAAQTRSSVASHPAQDIDPLWSPDGRYLVFRSDRAASRPDLWGIEVRNGKQHGSPFLVKSDIGQDIALLDWTRSGKLTYFSNRRLQDVWALSLEPHSGNLTGERTLISKIQGVNGQPSFSADGKRIAYRTRRQGQDDPRLVIARLDGQEEQEVRLPSESFFNPTWSPEGKIIVYAIDWKTQQRYFLEYDPSTKSSRTFLKHAVLDNPYTPIMDFSSDGRHFVFSLWSAPLSVYDGTSVRHLPGTKDAQVSRWSPDGSWIAYRQDEALWLIRPDGSSAIPLIKMSGKDHLNHFAWSPDGSRIVYVRTNSPEADDDWALWVVSLDGSTHRKIEGTEGLNPWWIDWSPDGSHLAVATTPGRPELWVMENFMPASPRP